jgi:hypothetical protein
MICTAKPVLIEELCVVQKEEFLITCYKCDTYTWRKAKRIHNRQTHILVREEVRYMRTITAKVQLKKKSLVVGLKGFDSKTEWQ